MPSDLRNKLITGVALGLAVVLALVMFSDVRQLAASLEAFRWSLLPLILALTLVNYALRFVKWHYYLGRIGCSGVSLRTSAAIFLGGLTMAMTPGKVGELLKSVLLRRVSGTPVSVSAPIVMAERLTDGIALLLLSAGGLFLYRVGVPLLVLIAVLAAAVVAVSTTDVGMRSVLGASRRLPFVQSRLHHVQAIYKSSRSLLAVRPLLLAVGLGIASWGGECAAFYLVLRGLGVEGGWSLLVLAAFVLGTSTLVGSASLLPGGLGVADATVAGLLLITLPRDVMDRPDAVAATLLIRFATLWFGAALGVVTLLATRTTFRVPPEPALEPAETAGV